MSISPTSQTELNANGKDILATLAEDSLNGDMRVSKDSVASNSSPSSGDKTNSHIQSSSDNPEVQAANISKEPKITENVPKNKVEKKGRIVPSRYMQAAKTGPMKATDASFMRISSSTTGSSGDGSRHMPRPTYHPPSFRPKRTSSLKSLSKPTFDFSRYNRSGSRDSPRRRHQSGSTTPQRPIRNRASTPTTEFGVVSLADCDVSAISVIAGSMMSKGNQSNLSSRSNTSRKDDETLTDQQQLDLLHNTYVQYAFLNMRAREGLHKRSEQALVQLHGLKRLVEDKEKSVASLREDLWRLRHLQTTDKLLKAQNESLTALESVLPKTASELTTLAEAVDNTQHNMKTRNVYLPPDKQLYAAELLSALEETEKLVGELCLSFGNREELAKTTASSLQQVQASTDAGFRELLECHEAYAAFESLKIKETSLLIQKKQIDEMNGVGKLIDI